MAETVIELKNVTKKYRMITGSKAKASLLFGKSPNCKEKVAVSDMSFKIEKGESVAIIGRNGSGKTTILKMIAGVSFPTEGEVETHGKMSAMLELSAGFDPEFTGRENLRFRGQILGMSDEEIALKEPEIVKYAELGEYMDMPTRTYSNGMRTKLGFAINTAYKPEILLIDEAISVGDGKFKQKSLETVQQMIADDEVTFLFVTNSSAAAKKFCKRGIVISEGKLYFDGPVEEACQYYRDHFVDWEAINNRKKEKAAAKKALAGNDKPAKKETENQVQTEMKGEQ